MKWTWEAGVAGEPVLDGWGLESGVVVADHMDVESRRDVPVDPSKELQVLLVAAVQLADHGAVGDVEGGEQAGHAVAGVAVSGPLGHAGHAGHHGEDRLGPVQGLDLPW